MITAMVQGADEVHPRRTVEAPLGGTGYFECYPKPGEYHRGVAEKIYGYPIDVDAVWRDRDMGGGLRHT